MHVLSFGASGRRWTSGDLTWSLDTTNGNLNNEVPRPADVPGAIRQVAQEAFSAWRKVLPANLLFTDIGSSGGNIHIRFGGSELAPNFGLPANDPNHWDGQGDFPPPQTPNQALQTIFLDLSKVTQWSRASLFDLVVHELGHTLGLTHSNDSNSTMFHFVPSLAYLDAIDGETADALDLIYGWGSTVLLPNRASQDGPALATVNWSNFTSTVYELFMAWRGANDDTGIWWSNSQDGLSWSSQEPVPLGHSSRGPALCAYGRFKSQNLAMAFRGVGDDEALRVLLNPDMDGWRGAPAPASAFSSARPALANWGSTAESLIMTWKGAGSDEGIYWSRYDGKSWTPQGLIGGVGTSDSPALAVGFSGPELRLFMFWKGSSGDNSMWWSTLNPNNTWAPQRQVTFHNFNNDGTVQNTVIPYTSSGPSAAARDNEVVLVWKGVGSDKGIWCAPLRPDGWSGQVAVQGGFTETSPALCLLGSNLSLAWRGSGSDQRTLCNVAGAPARGLQSVLHDAEAWAGHFCRPQLGTSCPGTSRVSAAGLTKKSLGLWGGVDCG